MSKIELFDVFYETQPIYPVKAGDLFRGLSQETYDPTSTTNLEPEPFWLKNNIDGVYDNFVQKYGNRQISPVITDTFRNFWEGPNYADSYGNLYGLANKYYRGDGDEGADYELYEYIIDENVIELAYRNIFSELFYYYYWTYPNYTSKSRETQRPFPLRAYITNKYGSKWQAIYDALITNTYNPLDEYSENSKTISTHTDTIAKTNTRTKNGTSTDTTTYDTNITDNGKTSTKETETTSDTLERGLYGFNSSSAVGDNTTNGTTTITTVGDADSNTNENIRTKTGTESKSFGNDETENNNATETRTSEDTDTHERHGRKSSASDLLQKELDFRSKSILLDIICEDIAREITLPIY